MTKNSKKFLKEIFYKSLFLIPILIGLVILILLPPPGNKDPILIGAIIFAAIGMTYGCSRYGWNNEGRQKNGKSLSLSEQDNGFLLTQIRQIAIGVVGFLLVLIAIKILSIF